MLNFDNLDQSEEELHSKFCSKYQKLSYILPARKRIVAIGDIHGDLDVFIKILLYSRIIDKKLNWTAEQKIL